MADQGFITAILRERRSVSDDLGVFVFEPERPLIWQPGQYVTLGIERDNKLIERPYSICSSPQEEVVELFIELVPSGALTPLIWKLRAGDRVSLRPKTKGRFLLDTESGRTVHLMVSTVTGVAPYVSMLRRYVSGRREGKGGQAHQFLLLHGGSRSRELAYLEEFRRLSLTVEMIRYVPSVSRPWEEPDWSGEVGRAEDVLRKHLDAMAVAPSEITAYLCGHPGMIEAGRGILRRSGVPSDHIREEQYFPLPAG